MFRSREEMAELLATSNMVIMLGFFVVVVLLVAYGKYVMRRERNQQVNARDDLPAARVRGYVRKFGHKFEFGIRSVETGFRQRLGFRHTMKDAEQAIKGIMEPVHQNRVQRGADGS